MDNKSLQTGFLLKGNSYNYQIERVLGQGSFGITYLASVKMEGALGSIDVNIKVAIKEFFMRDINGRSDATVTSGSKGGIYDDYRRKFAREALNLSKLQHPNIIKVVEIFEANNTIYYVMEFIAGGSLDDYIAKNNGIKEDEAIKIVKQIGSALSFMHKNKMLHLDLKPSNIMMKESGDIVLIDFGLSKQYDPNGEPESSTKVGAGTPGYAPIEQANYREGKGFPVTMDVYALGGTMFKMLTGVRPTEASDILNDGFPLYELQEHNISDRISGSVAKAMAPIKKDRFQSVGEFLQSIDDEVSIIDTDVVTKKKLKEEINNSHPFIIKPQTKKVETSGNLLSYRLWALPILITELLFLWFMTYQCRYIYAENDGMPLFVFFCFASFLCLCYMFFTRKSMATKKWKMITYISTIACIANSCLLPVWKEGWNGAFHVLSIGLSLISSFTILIKKNN